MKKGTNQPKPDVESSTTSENKAEESAQFIATNKDRARAKEELLALDEPLEGSEINQELGNQEPAAWNEPPVDKGRQTAKVRPEDDRNPSQELVEKGLKEPNRSRYWGSE